MAKKMTNPPTQFVWSEDPAERFGELVEAAAIVERLKNEAIVAAVKAGYGRTAISKAAGVASSTVYHAMIRAGVHTPGTKADGVASSVKKSPAKKAPAKVTTKAKAPAKKATKPVAAATRSTRSIKARAK